MTIETKLLPWQQPSWDLLHQYIQQHRIPQALLITGASGLGKHALALQFAYSLLCSHRQADGLSCGHCKSCLLVKAESHPDLFSIEPEQDKSTISIKQMRQILTDTTLKPQFDAYRVIIIKPADAMTIPAANAFLKCLEEPGERTVFILIAERPSKLPATIISRCQILALTLNQPQLIKQWMLRQGIEKNQETLLNLVRSSILSLEEICDKKLLQQRSDCFNDWLTIAQYKSHPVMVAEKWQKLPKTALLNWQLSWLADVIKCAHRLNLNQFCNQDMAIPIQALAQELKLDTLYDLYDKLLTSRQQLDSTLNFQLMLEEILIQWQGLNRRQQ